MLPLHIYDAGLNLSFPAREWVKFAKKMKSQQEFSSEKVLNAMKVQNLRFAFQKIYRPEDYIMIIARNRSTFKKWTSLWNGHLFTSRRSICWIVTAPIYVLWRHDYCGAILVYTEREPWRDDKLIIDGSADPVWGVSSLSCSMTVRLGWELDYIEA